MAVGPKTGDQPRLTLEQGRYWAPGGAPGLTTSNKKLLETRISIRIRIQLNTMDCAAAKEVNLPG